MKKITHLRVFYPKYNILTANGFANIMINKLSKVHCNCFSSVPGNLEQFGHVDLAIFKPRRVVILSRITRYEFEKIWHKDATEEQFKSKVFY